MRKSVELDTVLQTCLLLWSYGHCSTHANVDKWNLYASLELSLHSHWGQLLLTTVLNSVGAAALNDSIQFSGGSCTWLQYYYSLWTAVLNQLYSVSRLSDHWRQPACLTVRLLTPTGLPDCQTTDANQPAWWNQCARSYVLDGKQHGSLVPRPHPVFIACSTYCKWWKACQRPLSQ